MLLEVSELPTRNEVHWPRRLFHAVSGVLLVVIAAQFETKRQALLTLVLVTSAYIAWEFVRLSIPAINRRMLANVGSLMRGTERAQLTGTAHYLMGCTLSMLVFPRSIALLAMLYLALGDPIASIVGVKYGKNFLNLSTGDLKKSFEGSVACLLFCAVLTFVVSQYLPMMEGLSFSNRIAFSILGGIAAALGEFLPLRTDDNLALPLIAGGFLWLSSAVFGLIPGLYL